MKKSNAMKRGRGVRRNNRLSPAVRQELNDGPAYAGQQVATFKVEGTPVLLTTAATTGIIANVQTLNTALITGFAARFGATFDEYRILSCRVKIRSVIASSGISKMWFDEKSNAAPTANEAQERTASAFMNTNTVKQASSMAWRAKDLLDLQYTAIGTASTPVYFKVYTDAATWGANPSTAIWVIEPDFTIEFRGIKST